MNVGKLIIAPLAANARRCVLSAKITSRTIESAVIVNFVSFGPFAAMLPQVEAKLTPLGQGEDDPAEVGLPDGAEDRPVTK